MATPGTYISGIGHTALVVWLIAGWGFQSDPLPFEISEVTVISGADFAALTAASTPDPGDAAPDAPQPPETTEAPVVTAPLEAVAPPARPEPVAPPVQEAPPPPAPEPPAPVAEVTDEAPEVPLPPQEPVAPVEAPVTEAPPSPEAAPRVAPEPVEAPEPEVQIADVATEATEPDEAPADAEPVEPVEATAPEAATTEIVTEADVPSGAVEVTSRPALRPNRPAPAPVPEPEVAETAPPVADQTDDSQAEVDAAVAAALAAVTADAPAAAEGPPMSASERDGFRVAVNRCWNVDPGSVASRVIVEVGFSLTEAGRVTGDVRLLSSDGDPAATDVAFQAARRAILRCQGEGGYQLPPEKYSHWKDVVITFDPSGMRLR